MDFRATRRKHQRRKSVGQSGKFGVGHRLGGG
jgi:hypothetical protein